MKRSKVMRLKADTLSLIEDARNEVIRHHPDLRTLCNDDEFVIRYALVRYIES